MFLKKTIKQEKINEQMQSLKDMANKQIEETNQNNNNSTNNESEQNDNKQQEQESNKQEQQKEENINHTSNSNNEVNNVLDIISAKNTNNLLGSFIETLKNANNQ